MPGPYNYTPITNGLDADEDTFNAPLAELDDAIGDLATLTTTEKGTIVGAINEVDGLIGIGSAAAAGRRNAVYTTKGTITWDSATEILTFSSDSYVLWGKAGGAYLRIAGPFSIDFSGVAAGSYGYAYIPGIVPNTTQNKVEADIVVVTSSGALATDLMDDGIVLVAEFANDTRVRVQTPWTQAELSHAWAGGYMPALNERNFIYHNQGTGSWNPTTEILSFSGNLYVFWNPIGSAYLTIKGPISIDFSGVGAASFGIAYLTGIVPGTSQVKAAGDITVVAGLPGLADDLRSESTLVVAFYAKYIKGQVQSPFMTEEQSHRALTGEHTQREPWVNLYPHALAKLDTVFPKLLAPAADFKLVLWGDSIFARTNHTSAGSIDPTALPPLLVTRNIAWYIYNYLPFKKAVYRRYDYTGYFTEIGTWVTDDDDAAWDDALDRPGHTRLSAPAGGEVGSFSWTLGVTDGESGCNLIYRTDTGGDAAAPITVSEGDGFLEYWTGAAWAEANGATMSFREVDEGARRGNTIYGKRLRLRKAAGHENDSVTITVSRATADRDRLLYWGVELYDAKNGTFILQLINAARGSHTFDSGALKLYDYMDDDVIDMDPDLVIVEIPLLNMMGVGGATKASIVNSVQDMFWGDRGGATNSWNLKTQSTDWADFQVIAVMPHHSRSHYNADSSTATFADGVTRQDVYNAVKALFWSHTDVPLIDMAAAFEHEIQADALWDGDIYNALNGTSTTGNTYTTDGVHPNDRGVAVYARHICPLLDGSSA